MRVSQAPCDWQRRRSAFNHDWLKNTYINRLREFVQRLDCDDPDTRRAYRFLREDFPQWRKHEDEVFWLAESFEEEMTPRTLFVESPLCNVEKQTHAWLPDLIHILWLHRSEIKDKVKKLKKAVSHVQDRHRAVSDLLPDKDKLHLADDTELLSRARQYLDACIELTEALSNFPKGILVV